MVGIKDGSWNSMISAHIVNPFQLKSCTKKWANNPRYRDPSLLKYVLIRCDSSHSCVWWNKHKYRFVPLVDLIVASGNCIVKSPGGPLNKAW